jgi:hypothetical protein
MELTLPRNFMPGATVSVETDISFIEDEIVSYTA